MNCPKLSAGSNGQLAIVLDGKVQSAPSINEPTFADGTLQISGSFTEGEAREFGHAQARDWIEQSLPAA